MIIQRKPILNPMVVLMLGHHRLQELDLLLQQQLKLIDQQYPILMPINLIIGHLNLPPIHQLPVPLILAINQLVVLHQDLPVNR